METPRTSWLCSRLLGVESPYDRQTGGEASIAVEPEQLANGRSHVKKRLHCRRRQQALEVLHSDEFWEACNDDDGDLFCVWAFPGEAFWINLHELWTVNDTHRLSPSRVPTPPAFAANHGSGVVAPKPRFRATSAERRQWTLQVAHQVDAWLTGVAEYLAAAISPEVRRDVLAALAKEETLRALYAAGQN